MKKTTGVVLLWAVCVGLPLARGAESVFESKTAGSPAGEQGMGMELDANYGYVAGSPTHTGGHGLGEVSEQNAGFKYVALPELNKDLILRAGVAWERFSFGIPGGAPLPQTLQQISGIIGCDYQINDQWLMRAELEPGLYGDFVDFGWRTVDAPLVLAATYLADADLQWVVGLRIDVRSRYWLVPVAGVRWKYAEDWTLHLILPNPRLEYDLSKQVQLFIGASVFGGTYRLSDNFGTDHGIDPRANGAMLDYMELRAGPGVSWKVLPNVTIEAGVGAMLYREFEFSNPHMYIRSNSPAPYAQLSCHASF